MNESVQFGSPRCEPFKQECIISHLGFCGGGKLKIVKTKIKQVRSKSEIFPVFPQQQCGNRRQPGECWEELWSHFYWNHLSIKDTF